MDEIIIVEEWRNINGYLNYQVSNIGRVRNIKSGCILKPGTNHNGYLYLILCLNGKRKSRKVHHLVALAFIDNPMNKPTVDHIDCKAKFNNTVINLRWATVYEQGANKSKQLNTSSRYKGVCWYKSTSKWAAQIRIDKKNKHLGLFKSEEAAALAYNKAAIEHFGEFAWLNPVEHNQD